MTVIAGLKADFWIAEGTPVVFTNEACIESADGVYATITDQSKSFWDIDTAVVVEIDDGGGFDPVSSSDYVVEHAAGRVRFLTPINPAYNVRIDGAYLPAARCGGGRSWQLDLEHAVEDTTDFAAAQSGWRTKKAIGLNDGSLSVERWWFDESFHTLLESGADLIVRAFVDYDNEVSYSSFGVLSSDGITTVVDAITDEALDIDLTGGVWYRAA